MLLEIMPASCFSKPLHLFVSDDCKLWRWEQH